MNRRSFIRLLGLAPAYAAGGVVLFKALPTPTAKTLYISNVTTEYYGPKDGPLNPHAKGLWEAVVRTQRELAKRYEDTIV